MRYSLRDYWSHWKTWSFLELYHNVSSVLWKQKINETLEDQAYEPHTLMTAAASVSASCLMHQNAIQNEKQLWMSSRSCVTLSATVVHLEAKKSGLHVCWMIWISVAVKWFENCPDHWAVTNCNCFRIPNASQAKPPQIALILSCKAPGNFGIVLAFIFMVALPCVPSCSNKRMANKCLFLSSSKQHLQTNPPHRTVYWWFFLASIMRLALLAN